MKNRDFLTMANLLTRTPRAAVIPNMNVNKTPLHPAGVQPHFDKDHGEHEVTEVEEALYETAHIDYSRVSIVRLHLQRPSTPERARH